VPLGEDTERYQVTIQTAGLPDRIAVTSAPNWSGPAAQGSRIRVAQLSARFGAGPDASVVVM